MPTQERLKQAKRRRALQLKKWQDYEIELNLHRNLNNVNSHVKNSVKFQDHIMLLDSVMRKDYNEGKLVKFLNKKFNFFLISTKTA